MLYAIFQSRSILTWAKYGHATLIKYKNSPLFHQTINYVQRNAYLAS